MSDLKKQENTSKNGLIATAVILALLFLGALGGAYHYSNESDTYANKTVQLTSELTALNDEKLGLEAEVSQLTETYEAETVKNTELEAKIADAEAKIKGLKGRIYRIKKELADTKISNEEMQQRIAELNTAKEDLIAQIADLELNNQDLSTAKTFLSGELVNANEENTQLTAKIEDLTVQNEQMQNRLFTLAPAGFQATGFQVQVAGKREKLTAKAKQARAITVDFDLLNVPTDLQKEHEVYLVVTDGEGIPVKKIPSTLRNVPTADGDLKVEVADMETIALAENQKLSMAFQPTDKMDAGLYNVALWSNAGYLGSTAFSLR
ncbi:MAG: hypothetical protein AAGJ18_14045 [Bacteroidota bacterium]